MNLFDGRNGKNLGCGLAWINEPESWGFADGTLHVVVPEAADFFEDPAGVNVRSSAPFLYSEVDGDFSFTARVAVDMLDAYDSACVMVMVDHQHWAKLCFELVGATPTLVSVVTKGLSDNCIGEKIGAAHPYLRVLRSGNCFGFHYSPDAINWTLTRFFAIDAPARIKVGVVGQCPVGKGTKVSFASFDLAAGRIRSAKVVA